MAVPALKIPLSLNMDSFKKNVDDAKSATSEMTSFAIKKFVDLNASAIAASGSIGGMVVGVREVTRLLGPIALGITAVVEAFRLMGYMTELAKQQIEDFNKLAEQANAAGFSTQLFQRIAKAAEGGAVSVDTITESLKRFNEASTDRLGGSYLQQRLDELQKAGNATGLKVVGNDTEGKLRSVVSLIDQMMQKGERLAALDIAGKAFGPDVRTALQQDSGYLTQMIQSADKMSAQKLVSDEDVGRAIELKNRMEEAQKILAEKWKPVQDDLAKLGTNYHESWVNITEDLAAAVGYATQLYTELNKVPQWFATRIGGASVWKSLTDATGAMGLNSEPEGMVHYGQPGFNESSPDSAAGRALAAGLRNPAAVRRAMQQATDAQSAVRGDTSKNPTTAVDDTDAVDKAIDSLTKHTAQVEATTKAVGLGTGALARFKAEAAEAAAVQANDGEETAEQARQFKILQDRAEAAAVALAKAKVGDDISRGRQTALLSPEDVAIANQLKDLYPNVANALNSVEASALKTNQALSSVSSQVSGDLTSGLTDIATGTKSVKAGFSDMAASIIRDIEQMIIKLYVVGPLMKGLQGAAGGMFGGTGSVATDGVGGFGPTAPAGYDDGGYTGAGGKYTPAGIVHKGEVVFSQDDVSRLGGVNVVEALRRGYASGGIVGMPSISVPDNVRGGGGDVTINNYGDNQVSAEKTPNGGTLISIRKMVDQAVGDSMSTGTGRRVLSKQYGVNQFMGS